MGNGAIDSDTSRSRDFSLSLSGGLLRDDFSSSMISSIGICVKDENTVKQLRNVGKH